MTISKITTFYDFKDIDKDLCSTYDIKEVDEELCSICIGTETGPKKVHNTIGRPHIYHIPCIKEAAEKAVEKTGTFTCPDCRSVVNLKSLFSPDEINKLKKKIEGTNFVRAHMIKNAACTLFVYILFSTIQINQVHELFGIKIDLPPTMSMLVGFIDAYRRDKDIQRFTRDLSPPCTFWSLVYIGIIPVVDFVFSYAVPNLTIYNVTLPISSVVSAVSLGIYAYVRGVLAIVEIQLFNYQPN